MGELSSDGHYIYYCGQESLRRNGVAIMISKRVQNAVLGCNLKNDRMISVHFQGNHTPHTADHPAAFVCYPINTPAPCLQGGEFETSFPISVGSLCCRPQHFGLLHLGQNEPGSVTETMARNDRDLNTGSGSQDAKWGLDLKKI